jgi:hypothetical protein
MRISNRRNSSLFSSRRRSTCNSPKQQMQQVHQPLQQEEPRQSPLQKGNQVRKLLSKDEILNCVNGIEQDRPKYKPDAPMLSEANVKAAGPNCAKFHAYVMEHSKDKLAFPARWIKTTLKVVVVL